MSSLAAEATPIAEAAGAHVAPLMARVEDRLAEVAGGHGAVLEGFAAPTIAAGGKRLRPLLLLVAAGELSDESLAEGLVRAGAAVELVHSATLVHDDVLDAAALRRGRPTVWATAGRTAATATGDALFAAAFAELARNDSAEQIRALSAAGSALALGELVQREDAFAPRISVERYLWRCELKTARLFEAACRLGALQASRPADGPALAAFGRSIGIAFQVLDDVLDVEGPAQRTGKPRGTDLLDGTVTLPLVLARRRRPELAIEPVRTPEAAEALCDAIAATGALEEARAYALGLVEEAKAGLGAMETPPSPRRRRALDLVADGVVARYA